MPRVLKAALGPAIAIAIPLLIHIRVVFGWAHFTFDYDGYHFPIASTLYQGFPDLVTWDRYSYGGIALSSNLQTAALHPPQLLVFAVSRLVGAPDLTEYAFGWVNLQNLVLLALGAYFLGRRLTGSSIAGIVGAAVVSAAGTVLSQEQHMGVIGTFAPLPLIVLCLLAIRRDMSREVLVLATLGMTAGLGYALSAGFIPQFVALGVVLAVVALALAITEPRAALRRFAALVAASIGAALLNAGALASFLLTAGQTLQVRVPTPIAPAQLLTVLVPNAFGLREWPDTEWAVDPTTHYAWGGVAFLVLLVAFFASRPGRRAVAPVLAALFLVGLALTPALPTISSLGGLFEAIRPFPLLAPSSIVIGAVAAPVAWARRAELRHLPRAVFLGVVGALAGGLGLITLINPSLAGFGKVAFGVWLLLTATVVVALLVAPRLARVAAVALVVVVVVEAGVIVATARFIEPPVDPSASLAPFGDAELLAELRTRPGLVAADNEVLGGPLNGWWSVWQVRSVNGFQPTYPARWDEAAEAASSWRDDRRFSFDRFDTGRPQQLSISTYVTTSDRATALVDDLAGSRVLWDKYGISFVAIPDVLPEATLESAEGSTALDLVWASDSVATASLACPATDATVSVVGVLDERWRATLDGASLGVGRVDGGRTEWAVAGCGELRLEFVDGPYLGGMLVSGITGLVAVALGLILLRRRRAARGAWRVAYPATEPTAS